MMVKPSPSSASSTAFRDESDGAPAPADFAMFTQ
jgi:hypothetical protein